MNADVKALIISGAPFFNANISFYSAHARPLIWMPIFLFAMANSALKKCTVYHILKHLFAFLLCALCDIHISPRGDSFRLTGCLLCIEHTYHDIGAFNIVKRMYFYRFCIDNFIRKRAISMELDACSEAKKLPCTD